MSKSSLLRAYLRADRRIASDQWQTKAYNQRYDHLDRLFEQIARKSGKN